MVELNKKPRHPKFAIPKSYYLKLKTDYSAGIFAGAVEISVSVVSETKFLVLDAVGLSVNPKSVSFASENKVLKAVRVELVAKEEMLVLEFKEKLPIGYGFLTMEFEGSLNARIKGFLRSILKDNNGETTNTVETKSMPAGARWCFPCWDEPHYLATLKVTIEVVAPVWEGRSGQVRTIIAGLVAHVALRGILRPPGGYWQEHFSDHPERAGYAVMAYTRPEVFGQFMFFNGLAIYAALGLFMVQISWVVGGWGCVRAQMVLLWVSISALMLSCFVLLLDMRAMVSLPLWLGLMALGLYVMLKHGYVEEKVKVYEVEGVV